MSDRLISRNILLDEEKHARLRAIAEAKRVPAAALLREALDRVLDLAEKQQNTIERVLGKKE